MTTTNTESQLNSLLEVTQKIHDAAIDSNWEVVQDQDLKRHDILKNLKSTAKLKEMHNRQEIATIIKLDKAILSIAIKQQKILTKQVIEISDRKKVMQAYIDF